MSRRRWLRVVLATLGLGLLVPCWWDLRKEQRDSVPVTGKSNEHDVVGTPSHGGHLKRHIAVGKPLDRGDLRCSPNGACSFHVCPGDVCVTDADGRPVVGATLLLRGGLPEWRLVGTGHPVTGEGGCVEVRERPCGPGLVSVITEAAAYEGLPIDVEPGWAAWVRLPEAGWVDFIVVGTDDGEPMPGVEPVLRGPWSGRLERSGEGAYRLWSTQYRVRFELRHATSGAQSIQLPVDGGAYVVPFVPSPWRQVDVHVLCDDDCPAWLECGGRRCTELGELSYRCSCSVGPSPLAIPVDIGEAGELTWIVDEDVDIVPPGVDRWEVDLTLDPGVVSGTWGGGSTCSVRAHRVPVMTSSQRVTCDGGRFELTLRPGRWSIEVVGAVGPPAARVVDLAPGEHVELDRVDPPVEVRRVRGRIEAPFALTRCPSVSSFPSATLTLSPSGEVVVDDVVEGAEMGLGLACGTFGTYRTTFRAVDGFVARLEPAGEEGIVPLEEWVIDHGSLPQGMGGPPE